MHFVAAMHHAVDLSFGPHFPHFCRLTGLHTVDVGTDWLVCLVSILVPYVPYAVFRLWSFSYVFFAWIA